MMRNITLPLPGLIGTATTLAVILPMKIVEEFNKSIMLSNGQNTTIISK